MSFLFRLFRKTEEGDETVLSNLARDIQNRQLRLDEIRLRERRTTLAVTLWSFALWGIYSGIWFMGLPSRQWRNKSGRVVAAAAVLFGPIVILFLRRLVQLWYERIGNTEERFLRELRKKQHTKVEEIKKKTNFYSTRDLLQKYDQDSPSNSPLRTPQRPAAVPNGQNGKTQMTPVPANTPNQQNPRPIIQAPPPVQAEPRRYWYDRLADVVLGEDDKDIPRYALICEKCFTHNGLVKEAVWEETQYVCPKCQHLNLSLRAKKEKDEQRSPVQKDEAVSPKSLPNSPFSPRSE